jgi:hypothetical protein
MKQIQKNYDDCNIIEKLAIHHGVAKAVDIPTAMRVSGQLLPEQIKTTLSLIKNGDKFIKMINMITAKSKTIDLNLLNVNDNGLIAPNYGVATNAFTQNLTNIGTKLTLEGLQYPYFLSDDVLLEKMDDPSFMSEVEQILIGGAAKAVGKLALKGTADTKTGTQGTEAYMLTCSTGFPTLFLADSDVNDVAYSSTDRIAMFKLMNAAMPAEFSAEEDLTIFVSKADYDAYADDLHALNASGDAYLTGKPLFFNSIPVEWLPQMPAATAFMSPKKNLVFAASNGSTSLETARSIKGAGYDIVLNFHADFGYFTGKAVVYAYTA